MKPFLKTLVITGSTFGTLMGMLACVLVSVLSGISEGICLGLLVALGSGLLFGLPMASFAASQHKAFQLMRAEFQEETLWHDGPANHFVNRESVGGWLFLTDKRLLFRSHKFNVQPHEWSIPLTDIADAQAVLTWGIIPNGLRIFSVSGRIDNFVVEANRKWREQVLAARTRVACTAQRDAAQ